jgi:hypothetical protein
MIEAFTSPQNFPGGLGGFGQDVRVFYAFGGDVSIDRTRNQLWEKPRNASFIFMWALSAGGGGGGGRTRTAGNAGGGGGGGGGGALTTLLIPAPCVPDRLYIYVPTGGLGGVGGAPAVAGSAGSPSYISAYHGTSSGSITLADCFIVSGSGTNAGGGGLGSTTGAAAAGAANGASTTARCMLGNGGNLSFLAGAAGGAGGNVANGAGTGTTFRSTSANFTNGGGGGGGTTSADTIGGTANDTSDWNIDGLGGTATVIDGQAGPLTIPGWFPFLVNGGGGGSAFNNSAGGNGGAGAYGCGGGGGGAGTTGGRGGKGGDGLVIIVSW